MKKSSIILAAILMSISTGAFAGQDGDDRARAMKIKELEGRKAKVEAQIKEEDKKRNQVISDVSPARLEQINDEQDKKCLQLRSELVDINLELEELGYKK